MARTHKKIAPKPYRKENKVARKLTSRKLRHSSKLMMTCLSDVEDIVLPNHQKTSGWMTH